MTILNALALFGYALSLLRWLYSSLLSWWILVLMLCTMLVTLLWNIVELWRHIVLLWSMMALLLLWYIVILLPMWNMCLLLSCHMLLLLSQLVGFSWFFDWIHYQIHNIGFIWLFVIKVVLSLMLMALVLEPVHIVRLLIVIDIIDWLSLLNVLLLFHYCRCWAVLFSYS